MGHQLLLTASIPHAKYTQTISTLEALTGLRRPQTISSYNILTKPHNVFKPVFEPGKVNQIEQYYMKCLTTWDDEAAKNLDLRAFFYETDGGINVDRLFSGKEVKHWTLQILDIPNAGKNPVLAQNFYESTIVHHHSKKTETKQGVQVKPEENIVKAELDNELFGAENGGSGASDPIEIDADPIAGNEAIATDDGMQIDTTTKNESPAPETKDSFLQFIENLGYEVVNQYWLKGVRFFYGDIVIEIFKIFVRDDAAESQETKIKLQVLDLSNTFQVKAYISYPKGTGVDTITKGTKTLTDLKAKLQNLFDLEVPDRMSMDSRVPRV